MPTTARFGARCIGSKAAATIAGHAVLDTFARDGTEADAVIIACFGDPGVFALREPAPLPVVGMAEGPAISLPRSGENSPLSQAGIVGARCWKNWWPPLGPPNWSSVRTVDALGGDIAAKPEAALDSLASACREATHRDGSEVGGPGRSGTCRIGRPSRFCAGVPVPVIDNAVAAVKLAEAAATLSIAKAKSGSSLQSRQRASWPPSRPCPKAASAASAS